MRLVAKQKTKGNGTAAKATLKPTVGFTPPAAKATSKAANLPPKPPLKLALGTKLSEEALRLQRREERAEGKAQEALRVRLRTARLPGMPQLPKLLAPPPQLPRQSSANYDARFPPAPPQLTVPGDPPEVTGVFITEMIKY